MQALQPVHTDNAVVASAAIDYDLILSLFVAELDAKPSTRVQYGKSIKQFFSWVKDTGRNLDFVSRIDIIAFRDSLLNGEYGEAKSTLTTSNYLTAVKMFYKWAAGRIPNVKNVADGVKLPKRANKFNREALTPTQAQKLIAEASTGSLRDNAIINLLTRTGLRTIEVIRANVGDLTFKGGQAILLVQGKGRDSKDSFVILSDKCRAAIQDYLATREDKEPTAPLFTSESKRNNGERLTTRTIRKIAKDSLVNVGLDSRSYSAHSLRHTCAVSMLRNGTSMEMVQKTLRHSNPATTQIYTYHLDEQRRLEQAAEKQLDNLF